MDTVLPTPGSVPRMQEAMLRVRDLTMLQAFNAKERELEDWTALVGSVRPRLGIKGVVQPKGSVMAVIEVGLEGDGHESEGKGEVAGMGEGEVKGEEHEKGDRSKE